MKKAPKKSTKAERDAIDVQSLVLSDPGWKRLADRIDAEMMRLCMNPSPGPATAR